MTETPIVGIVTRTKDRTVLLKRAVESVLAQSHAAWELIVVNDGGAAAPVDALIARYAAAARGRIRVVHNAVSRGMEGASAIGLAATSAELLVIHDDDDSWAPEFLRVALAELRLAQQFNADVQGVTTYCNRVFERIRGQTIEIASMEAFNDWLEPGYLSLDRMLVGNVLPPISFVFTRAAFAALGNVYEVIPYLGDWDFMIRFLAAYEIVVVPQFLAFYHWRTPDSAFGNSVTAELDKHRFYRQMLLNRWLRADLAAGRFGIGTYANLRGHLESIMLADAAQRAHAAAAAAGAPPLEPPPADVAQTPEQPPQTPETAPQTPELPAARSAPGLAQRLRRRLPPPWR